MSTQTRTDYEVLGVEATASPEEIKRAYRRQMALYHPDRLQHLGREFVDLALKRTTELTQAYTALSRRPNGSAEPSPRFESPPGVGEPTVPKADGHAVNPAVEDAFLKSAALSTFRKAAVDALGDIVPAEVPGFDAAFTSDGKSRLFRASAPSFLLLVRIVPIVDAGVVEDAWRAAARIPVDPHRIRCAFVMGQGLAPTAELAGAVARQRDRPVRTGASVILVPVDLRSWQSLVPSDAPDALRAILDGFRR